MTALARRHAAARELQRLDPDRPPGRKTSRTRAAATPTHVAPTLKLAFLLPPAVRPFVSPGPHGHGVEVSVVGTACATLATFNRDRLIALAAEFLQRVTPRDAVPFTALATFTSSSEPGWKATWRLAFVDGHVTAALTNADVLIFPRKS